MAVAAAPAATRAMPPSRESKMASARNWIRVWPLVAPRARAEPEEKVGERAGRVVLGGERVRRLGDVDIAGILGVGLGAEQVVDAGGGGLGVDGADVDLRRVAVEVQVFLRGREADQDL